MPLEGEPTIFINTMELHAAHWYHWLDEGAGGQKNKPLRVQTKRTSIKTKNSTNMCKLDYVKHLGEW